jgi:hypothetical protein
MAEDVVGLQLSPLESAGGVLQLAHLPNESFRQVSRDKRRQVEDQDMQQNAVEGLLVGRENRLERPDAQSAGGLGQAQPDHEGVGAGDDRGHHEGPNQAVGQGGRHDSEHEQG